jgi:hypothetical protein
MLFFESERIKSKNKVQNEAYELLEAFKSFGYSLDDIKKYINFAITVNKNVFRNDVYLYMLKTLKVNSDEANKT